MIKNHSGYGISMVDEGKAWLKSLSVRGIKPGLENMTCILDALGNPQRSYRTIHVAGSDGKGSVCCMLESILISAGFRVGMFTSPEIISVNECIRIDGQNIEDGPFEDCLKKVMVSSDKCDCTNFEALTACAFLAFKEAEVDIAVIEVGMGGRLDSTNVLDPDVTIINNISMEHTQFLGDDIRSIASEKAGIMRPGIPCITINTGESLEVIKTRAEELNCPLVCVDPENVDVLSCASDHTMIRYNCNTYRLGLPGSYQGRNASLVIEAILALKDASRIRQFIPIGLDAAVWPCRMQKIDGMPLIIDATHTVKGAEFLAKDIERIYGKVTLVTAMLSDKDLDGVAGLLSKIATRVLVSSPNSPRAAPAETLASQYRKYHDDVTVYGTVAEAVEAALEQEGTVLVTGSFRTAEDCLRWLRRTR